MGNNATDDMMTRLTKRLTINDGGSGSKLEFYLSNSILLVVRDSTPDCHAIFARCHRDRMRWHAMSLRSHAIECDVMRSRKKTFLSSTVRVLENTPGTRGGTESFAQRVSSRQLLTDLLSLNFFRLSQKRRNEKRDSFYTANVFLPDEIWFSRCITRKDCIQDSLELPLNFNWDCGSPGIKDPDEIQRCPPLKPFLTVRVASSE
jgi:hypothetical protein